VAPVPRRGFLVDMTSIMAGVASRVHDQVPRCPKSALINNCHMVIQMSRLFVLLSILLVAGCSDPTGQSQDASSDSGVPVLKYEIVEKDDTSYAGTPRMVYRVVVRSDSIPSEEAIRSTAIAVENTVSKTWKEFTVFLYLPDMNTASFAYGVAEFRGHNLSSFQINETALYGTKWRSLEEDIQVAEEQWEEQWEESKKSPKVKEYSIRIDVKKLENRTLDITATTDFPDNTNLLIGVRRSYFEKGTSDEYSGDIFDRDMPVTGGKIQINVPVDDKTWLRDYKSKQQKLPDMFPGISKISDDVTIRVLYSPKRDQPEHIANVLGKNAEFVAGELATRTGNFTTMSVEQNINMPVSQ